MLLARTTTANSWKPDSFLLSSVSRYSASFIPLESSYLLSSAGVLIGDYEVGKVSAAFPADLAAEFSSSVELYLHVIVCNLKL